MFIETEKSEVFKEMLEIWTFLNKLWTFFADKRLLRTHELKRLLLSQARIQNISTLSGPLVTGND